MRLTFAIAAVALLAALPAMAADTAQQTTMKGCAAKWKAMPAADQKKTTYKEYMSTCMKSPAPAAAMTAKPAAAPAASTAMTAKPAATATAAAGGKAKCKDGTVVTYKNRAGTCSGHKGVDTWM